MHDDNTDISQILRSAKAVHLCCLTEHFLKEKMFKFKNISNLKNSKYKSLNKIFFNILNIAVNTNIFHINNILLCCLLYTNLI